MAPTQVAPPIAQTQLGPAEAYPSMEGSAHEELQQAARVAPVQVAPPIAPSQPVPALAPASTQGPAQAEQQVQGISVQSSQLGRRTPAGQEAEHPASGSQTENGSSAGLGDGSATTRGNATIASWPTHYQAAPSKPRPPQLPLTPQLQLPLVKPPPPGFEWAASRHMTKAPPNLSKAPWPVAHSSVASSIVPSTALSSSAQDAPRALVQMSSRLSHPQFHPPQPPPPPEWTTVHLCQRSPSGEFVHAATIVMGARSGPCHGQVRDFMPRSLSPELVQQLVDELSSSDVNMVAATPWPLAQHSALNGATVKSLLYLGRATQWSWPSQWPSDALASLHTVSTSVCAGVGTIGATAGAAI